MSFRSIMWVFFGVVLMALGILWYFLRPGAIETPFNPRGDAPNEQGRVDEHAAYYDVAATYPTETPLSERAGRAAVDTMRSFINSTIAQFKIDGNFSNLTEEDIVMLGYVDGRKQTLQIGYVSAASPHTVSYVFTIYTDSLGAHGNTDFKTFTFDSQTGALLGLSDLFTSSAPHLERLSRISRERLAESLEVPTDDLMLVTGTEQTVANFSHFFLDDTSLVLLFPPYAVAPYAAGSQTLAIPRSELAALLRPEYQ